MTKDTAPESELNALHGVVAKVLRKELEAHEQVTVTDADGNEQVVEMSNISPAMVAQAIKFLKDNNITATPETDTNLNSLKEVLEKKQKKGRLHLVDPKQAVGED